MTTLQVAAAPHDEAIDAFYNANHDATDAMCTLVDALAGCSAMAGTDSGGLEWGAQYDDAADSLRLAGTDLANALGNMANLLNANLINHDRADYGAVLTVHGPTATAADTGDPDPTHYNIDLTTSSLPSAAGGNGGAPHGWSLIASHLEGFLWPDADTGKLRSAGDAWRTAAGKIDFLAYDVGGAQISMHAVVSPEMDLVDAACNELENHSHDLGDAMRGLGDACHDYADQVDDHHHQIISLLESLLAYSVADQVIGGIISVFTVGTAEAPTQGIEAGIIARYAVKVLDVLKALKTIASGWAAKILVFTGKALRVSSKLAKFVKAERVAAKLEKAGVLVLLRGKKLAGVLKIPTVAELGKLPNYVKDFYKGVGYAGRTGDGTTADAIRYELATGGKVGGKGHIIKGQNLVRGLEKWLKNFPDAPAADRAVAESMLKDLQAALSGH